MFGFKKVKKEKAEKTAFELYAEACKEFDKEFDRLNEITKKLIAANDKMTKEINEMVLKVEG